MPPSPRSEDNDDVRRTVVYQLRTIQGASLRALMEVGVQVARRGNDESFHREAVAMAVGSCCDAGLGCAMTVRLRSQRQKAAQDRGGPGAVLRSIVICSRIKMEFPPVTTYMHTSLPKSEIMQ
jgi:hypothetical protein